MPEMTHAELVQRAVKWLRGTKRCKAVLAERGVYGEFPDAIGWTYDGHSWMVECKVSRSDFLRDGKKDCRTGIAGQFGMGEHKYYMTLPGVAGERELPWGWGLVEAGPRRTRTVKRCNEDAWRPRADTPSIGVELKLLVSEVGRYQMHGITYPSLPQRTTSKGGEPHA